MHTHTHLKQNIEKSKHPLLLNYNEDKHTFIFYTYIFKHTQRQREWYISLHVLIHLLQHFANLISCIPSLFFSG